MGGNQFSIFGEVRLSTDQAAAGAKQVRSEIENLSKSGIAGFEAAQQKVIELTKRIAELRNALLQTSDPAKQKELNAQLDLTKARFTAARGELRGMSLESRETNEKVQMLAASLGVQVPAGMARILSRMPALTTAMEAAFSITIIGAFAAGIIALIPKIQELSLSIAGFGKEAQAAFKKAIEENQKLLSQFANVATGRALLNETNLRITALEREKEAVEKLRAAHMAFGPTMVLAIGDTRRLREIDSQLASLETLRIAQLPQLTKVTKEQAEADHKHADEIRAKIRAILEESEKLNKPLQDMILATEKAEVEAENAITKGHHDMAMEDSRYWDEQAYKALSAAGHITDVLKKQQQEAIKAQEAQRQMVEATANKIEGFIDRVFLTARSLGDVFHQFLMQILGSFVKWASRMAAEALLGMRQLSGAGGGGGGGGILGSILGIGGAALSPALSYAGGGTGGGTGIQAAFTGPLSAGTITQIGGGGGGIPTAAGGASSGVLGKLAFGGITSASQLGLMANAGMILGGGALLGSAGGPITGALGGGLMAAGGISMAAMLFPALAAIPGVGWIAAGILAAAMGLGALFGAGKRGQQKTNAAREQDEIAAAARQVVEEYKLHKADYEATVSTLETMLGNAQQSLPGKYNGPGRRAADYLTTAFADYIRQVNDLERQRQAVTTALSGFSIPEFQIGGFVGGQRPSGILALLHPGEFVMRREAVNSLGTDFLAALNRAPRFDAGGSVAPAVAATRQVIIQNMNVYPEKGMSRKAAMNMVVRGYRDAVMDGAL